MIASEITALSPIIIGLHAVNCFDFCSNEDRTHLLKISKSINLLLNKTVSGIQFDETDLTFIQNINDCLNVHPTLRVYGNNNDAFEVTIVIRNMVQGDQHEVGEEFKDIIRKTFSNYGLLHVFVQKRHPFHAYFVLPSFANFQELFETHNKKPLYTDGPPINLGFGYPPDHFCNFINVHSPTIVDNAVKNAYNTRIQLPKP